MSRQWLLPHSWGSPRLAEEAAEAHPRPHFPPCSRFPHGQGGPALPGIPSRREGEVATTSLETGTA